MKRLERLSPRIASRRLQRSISLLTYASTELYRAGQAAGDSYTRNRLRVFADGLRSVSIPLSRIASHLERGAQQ